MSDTLDPDILFEIPDKNKKMTLDEKLQLLNQGLTTVKKEKKKREITPEQREKMLQNLKKGREQKLLNKSEGLENEVKEKKTYKKKVKVVDNLAENDMKYDSMHENMKNALDSIRSEIQLLHNVIPKQEYIKMKRVELEEDKQIVKEEPVKEKPIQEQPPIMTQPVIKQQAIIKQETVFKKIYAGNVMYNKMPWD